MCVDCVCTRDGSAKRLRAEECGSPHSNGEAEIRLRSTNTVFQKGFEVIWQEVGVIKGIVAWQSSALTWRPLMLKRPIGYDTTSIGSRRKRRRSSTNSSMPCTNPFSVSFLPQCERAAQWCGQHYALVLTPRLCRGSGTKIKVRNISNPHGQKMKVTIGLSAGSAWHAQSSYRGDFPHTLLPPPPRGVCQLNARGKVSNLLWFVKL